MTDALVDRAEGAEPAASAPPASEERVTLGAIVTYSLPTFGAGFMFMLVTLLLMNFATDVLLIAPAAMGTIFMVSRLWDAVSDPLAGYWSDRTSTRWGRRRPFLFASALPVAASFLMMWSPPAELSGSALVAWMAVAVIGFYSAMTILNVPHASLGAELTTSYHDRTRVFGVRQLVWNVGTFLTLGGMWLLGNARDPRTTAAALSSTAAAATAALILWSAWRLRERPEYQGRGAGNPYRAFADVVRNPHARLLLVVFLVESLGGATVGALTIYFSRYVVETPSYTTLYIGAYFLAATLSIPLWVRISQVVGKKNLWFFSMLMTGLGFGSTFLLAPGNIAPFVAIALLLGTAAGCGNVVGPSIQADIIDWDEHRTRERKEGAYFAAWNFVFKSATGLTLGITGFVLQASGFVPNAEQTESARFAIRALYGLFPLVCYGVGALLFLRFSFNEREYALVRRDIESRRRSEDAP